MKAHVEQTRLENEIIVQNQESVESEMTLRALLNQTPDQELTITKDELKAPKLLTSLSDSDLFEKARGSSRNVRIGQAMVSEAQSQRTAAWLNFAPDFTVSYRQAFINAPPNAYAIGIEASIPLWFFSKEIPEVKAARARAVEAEGNLERMKRETESDARTLGAKVNSYAKLLQIYETSLIPQSMATLNSSRAAYRAGRTSFIELLDSERSLYSNRISYYQTLTKYIESLTRLERVLGTSISDLPFSGEKL
jgi:cobalt-zinc-cadmium efflux system outer membrane protein